MDQFRSEAAQETSEQVSLLKESYLKCAFLEHLRQSGRLDPTSIVASEFSLGRAGRRIDLAIWSGEFIGIEFKSKFDSLRRVTWQLEAYQQCFDRIIFVVDQKHASKIAEILPPAIEVWVVDSSGTFSLASSAGVLREQTLEGLANLCSIADLRRLCEASADRSYRGRKGLLTQGLGTGDVYETAIGRFKKTFSESSKAFWKAVGEQAVEREALPTLSRFAKRRQRLARIEEAERQFWSDWARIDNDDFKSGHV